MSKVKPANLHKTPEQADFEHGQIAGKLEKSLVVLELRKKLSMTERNIKWAIENYDYIGSKQFLVEMKKILADLSNLN